MFQNKTPRYPVRRLSTAGLVSPGSGDDVGRAADDRLERVAEPDRGRRVDVDRERQVDPRCQPREPSNGRCRNDQRCGQRPTRIFRAARDGTDARVFEEYDPGVGPLDEVRASAREKPREQKRRTGQSETLFRHRRRGPPGSPLTATLTTPSITDTHATRSQA